jgi:hypothetical protein
MNLWSTMAQHDSYVSGHSSMLLHFCTTLTNDIVGKTKITEGRRKDFL